jgi:hypothetical protein
MSTHLCELDRIIAEAIARGDTRVSDASTLVQRVQVNAPALWELWGRYPHTTRYNALSLALEDAPRTGPKKKSHDNSIVIKKFESTRIYKNGFADTTSGSKNPDPNDRTNPSLKPKCIMSSRSENFETGNAQVNNGTLNGIGTSSQSPKTPYRPSPPRPLFPDALAKHLDGVAKSVLDTFLINGRPIGDFTGAEARAWSAAQTKRVRFVEAIANGVPDTKKIREFIQDNEAAKILEDTQNV